MKKKLTEVTKGDIKSFIDGNWRMVLYNYVPSALTSYVKRQYEQRLEDGHECLMNGECLHCGCKTPELFMADKGCELGCYPPMKPLSKRLEIISRWEIRKIMKRFPILKKIGIKL